MLLRVLCICISTLCLSSCVNVYTPDSDTDQHKLVIRAEIESGSSSPIIEIGSSFNNFDSTILLNSELQVEMYEEGNPIPYMFNILPESSIQWQAPSGLEFVEGMNYFLKIDPSFYEINPVHAETTIPFPGTLKTESAEFVSSSNEIVIRLKLDPPPNRNSYYHLIPYVIERNGRSSNLAIDHITSGANAGLVLKNRSGILIDYGILSEDKYLSFIADFLPSEDIESLKSDFLYLALRTVTEDYYIYNKSLSQLTESNQNPFTLPTTTFTNISNGYGLFTAYSTILDSIRIE